MSDGAAARAAGAQSAEHDPHGWTILRLMLRSAEYLAEKGVPNARLDAEHLLAHALGMKRLDLYLQHERPVLPAEIDAFRPLLRRRARREPLQYIVGRQPFRELDLEVGPAVLVPRPETEVLVEEVLAWTRGEGLEEARALDLGTGSGAVALSLAREGPFPCVVATEISDAAAAVAERNRSAAGLDAVVDVRLGSWFEVLRPDERFDVIVSNPPYVADGDAPSLDPEVRDWEPAGALFAGPDGLDAVRPIVAGAPTHLRSGGLLALEVGAGQARPVADLLGARGYVDVRIRRDLAGMERIVLARRVPPDAAAQV